MARHTYPPLIQKEGQIRKHNVGARVFKLFQIALSVIDLPFSGSSNAQYGLKEATAMLFAMCEKKRYFRSASAYLQDKIKCPKADWLLRKIKTFEPEIMSARCDVMLYTTLKLALRTANMRTITSITVAIDKHLIPRYDKPADMRHNMTKGKSESGTSTFETYITAKIVAGFLGFNLACNVVDRGHFDDDFVRKIVQKCLKIGIPIRVFLMDREFYSVAVMRTMVEFGQNFIMPAIKNKGIQKAIKEHEKGKRGAVSEYTMKSQDGRKFTFNLVLVYNEKEKEYFVFATNTMYSDPASMLERITEEYKQRWGIETGYRCMEQMRPHTTSKNALVRIMLFYMVVIMYNLWMRERECATQDRELTLDMMLSCLAMLFCTLEEMSWACDPGGG